MILEDMARALAKRLFISEKRMPSSLLPSIVHAIYVDEGSFSAKLSVIGSQGFKV